MQLQELEQRLARGEIVRLATPAWEALAEFFTVRAQHDTTVSGLLHIIEREGRTAAVEEPTRLERVVRPLGDGQAVDAFVAKRLATYERMWDGCGCKVNYYDPAD